MSILTRILACAFALALSLASALAQKKVALVIGNGAYAVADKLTNPIIDARSVRDALLKIDFPAANIVYGENLDKRELERAIGRFAALVRDADVAILYYAGHGATFGDTPYLVPIDARFDTLDGMPYELTPLENIVGELRKAKGVRLAIIDACRDNLKEQALKRAGIGEMRGGEPTRGLAPPRNPDGMILAYATQYLSTAADGAPGAGSPFTKALVKHLPTPGLDVKAMFFRVGEEVVSASGGKQRPEIKVSMFADYALVAGAGVVRPEPQADPAAQAWAATQGSTSVAVLEAFAARFEGTVYAGMARARAAELLMAVVVPPQPAPSPPLPTPAPAGQCGGVVLASLASRAPVPLSRNEECALKAGQEFRECASCEPMVVVPAGSFMMGGGALEGYDYEYPRHRVTIANPFAVGKFTVTFAEWDACVAGGGCDGYLPDDWGWGRGRRPVITVSWRNAQSYVAWLKRTSGKEYRLLSEAEWEYAARGGRDTPFWWGATITPGQANYSGTIYNFDATFPFQNGGKGEYRKKTLPVDSFQPNPFGLYQVHGNVAQWVRDCWVDNYNGAPNDGSERITSDCRSLVLRGGSWQSYYWQVRAASRNSHSPDSQMSTVGFRVARKLNP